MVYIMSPQDRNPYYDSARDKPDRSEFASLRMPMQEKRPPPAGRGWLHIMLGVVAIVVIAIIAKRLFLP
jgi:hypothetical protein